MKKTTKHQNAYKTIGEITKELGLVDKRTGNLQTHTLRYWEKRFTQIKPTLKAGRRRYYSAKDINRIQSLDWDTGVYFIYLKDKK